MSERKIHYLPLLVRYLPRKSEDWLENMSLKGWHPYNVNTSSFFVFKFRRAAPAKYRYVVDFQLIQKKDYIDMYKSFGWELVGRISEIYIWRQAYTDKRPESFTDKNSLKRRNKRMSVYFLMFCLCLAIGAVGLTFSSFLFWNDLAPLMRFERIALIAVFSIAAALLGRIVRNLNKE